MKYYSNFKCYLGSKQRLSIFGREKDGKMEVFILKCNSKDAFIKKFAWIRYEYYLKWGNLIELKSNPKILLIPMEGSAQHTFNQFCNTFYVRKPIIVRYTQDVLIKKDNMASPIKIGKAVQKHNKFLL